MSVNYNPIFNGTFTSVLISIPNIYFKLIFENKNSLFDRCRETLTDKNLTKTQTNPLFNEFFINIVYKL